MGSLVVDKPHLVFVPFPAQGHINPMLTLAKLLHSRGFFITFVNTEYNHTRLLKSRGPDSVKGLDDFRFETVPDGLPATDFDRTQDIPALCDSIRHNFQPHFLHLLQKFNSTTSSSSDPPVTCIISDAVMSVTLTAAEQLNIPVYVFYTASACGVVGYLLYPELIEKGYVPLKDESLLTNGYLDTEIDWVEGMEGIRLRDLPSFIRTTDINDVMLNFDVMNVRNAPRAKAVILNTFEDLEKSSLELMRTKFGLRLFTVGPLSSLRVEYGPSKSIVSSLWSEDGSCVEWMEGKEAGSVVYVNFGSVTVMGSSELREMAWGIADAKVNFLWVVRPDLLKSEEEEEEEEGSVFSSPEFLSEVEGRGRFAKWCPQAEVLAHPSVGCFLTHSGWNSTLESISSGVPMICRPFFAEQQMNCRFGCTRWGVAMELGGSCRHVKREEVEKVVREMMGGGGKGEKMRNKAMEWKESAERAIKEGGSSFNNLEKLIAELTG